MKKTISLFAISLYFSGALSQSLVPAEKKGKWGFIKEGSQKFVIKPKFEAVMPFGKMLSSEKAFVKQTSKWGIIDTKGKWLIKPTYDTIFQLKKAQISWAIAKKEKLKVLLNDKGESISPTFSDFEPYNASIILVVKDKLWGLWQYENGTISEILPTKYEAVGMVNDNLDVFYIKESQKVKFFNIFTKQFSEEYDNHFILRVANREDTLRKHTTYLIVGRENKKGLLRPTDFQLILPIEFSEIRTVPYYVSQKTLFEVYRNGLYGIYDGEGKEVLSVQFGRLSYIYQDMILAMKNLLWGAYSKEGKQILSHLYQDIRYWKDPHLFVATKDSLQGLINYEEKNILPFNYQAIDILSFEKPFYIRLTQKKKQKIVIYDGEKIVPYLKEEYEKIQSFNEKYWYAQNLLKKMLIDKQTQKAWTIPPHTRLEDGKRFYTALVDSQKVLKRFAENQPEETLYLENNDKAFFWIPTKNKLTPTAKIQEWIPPEEQNPFLPTYPRITPRQKK